jgi:FAD/FMN-containing dehydrogenase
VAGTAVCEDGILIDLSAMRAVSVDPSTRIAHVQGGALWDGLPSCDVVFEGEGGRRGA